VHLEAAASFRPEAEEWATPWHVRASPDKRTLSGLIGCARRCQKRKWPSLFDHLVGAAEQGLRNGKAERRRYLHVDDQFDLH